MARIGVLEDSDDIRELIVDVLEGRGHAVVAWRTLAGARDGIGLFEPDLLVLDVELPDGCGLDLAGSSHRSGRPIPAIVLSSLQSEGDILRGFVAGAVDYLSKPFSRQELLAKISVRLACPTLPEATSACLALPERDGLAFGRYAVERLIGRGGFGEVHLARDMERDGARVALKVLAPLAGQQLEVRARFIRETYSASRLDDPRVAAVRDVGSAQGRLYYAMDYVDGPTLNTWIAEHGPATEAQGRALLRALLEGAVALQRAGIVHRDIKPENVVLRGGRPEDPVLVDFGLAKLPCDHGVTKKGFIMGTPAYLAPEVVRGGSPEHSSDMFQVGLTVRYAFTGEVPFPALTGLALLNTIVSTPVPSLRGGLSPGLCWILEKLVEPWPVNRISAAEALAAFETIDGPDLSRPPEPGDPVAVPTFGGLARRTPSD